MMMYWTSGWYVLESNDGISKKRNQSLIGFAYPVRPVHSGKWKDEWFYPIIIEIKKQDASTVYFDVMLNKSSKLF